MGGLRLAARRSVKEACRLLPRPWLLRLRAAYLGSTSPIWRRLVGCVIRGVRLRGVPSHEPFTVPGTYPALRMVPSDSYVTQHLYWLGLGGYETGEPAWWARLVASHRSVLEVGANVGLYTLVGAAASPATRYRAVEANPATCAVLRQNLVLNGLDHVDVCGAAVVGVGDGHQTVRLRVPHGDPYRLPAGAFIDRARGVHSRWRSEILVPAVPIADLIDGVDLVKLDIEGLEHEVLSAVRTWLAVEQPTLLVEVWDDAHELQALLGQLVRDLGYTAVAVTRHGAVEVPVADLVGGRLQSSYGTRDVTLILSSRMPV